MSVKETREELEEIGIDIEQGKNIMAGSISREWLEQGVLPFLLEVGNKVAAYINQPECNLSKRVEQRVSNIKRELESQNDESIAYLGYLTAEVLETFNWLYEAIQEYLALKG